MECNRDEAIRAKIIAEKKLADKDFAGAKKFTLKAQALYPGLDGIFQMLITLNVYISSESKVNGESDWYEVLDVKPSDDDETIRKQYRKLALMLHPDKNKLVGADGAFKILSEAWSLLSDKAKRLAYNQRRNLRRFQQKVSSQSRGPSTAPGVSGVHSFSNRATSKSKSWNSTTTSQMGPASVPYRVPPPVPARVPAPAPVVHRTDTFWTTCHRCKMHYEYLKVYLNRTLLCPSCHKPFLAAAMAAPINFPKPAHSSAHQRHQNSSNHAPSSKPNGNMYNPGRSTAAAQTTGRAPSHPSPYNNTNIHWDPSPKTNVPGNRGPSIVSKAANVVQHANDRLKREREEFHALQPLQRRKEEDDGQSSSVKIPYQMSTRHGSASTGSVSGLRKISSRTGKTYRFSSISKLNSTRELTPLETRNMLLQKAQAEIWRKLREWHADNDDQKHFSR